MIDGKGRNAVSDNASSQTCFLCRGTPKTFNDLSNFPAKFATDENLLEQYGSVCNMHAWERSFDGLNSVSDKLPLDKWRITDAEEKKVVAARKDKRKRLMYEVFGLVVDTPRAGGSGTSNTGNTARRAFQNEEKYAEILGIDPVLVHRIHVLLIAINADVALNADSFRIYARETAELWVSKYPNFYMPVSLHQLFIHAWESLRHSSLPITFFTEQSLESCNKNFKADRLHHCRRDTRLHTMTDLFNRQTDRSDLLIATKLQKNRKKPKSSDMPEDLLSLLKDADETEEADPETDE